MPITPAARERRQVQAPIFLISAVAWIVLVVKSGSMSLSGSCCPSVMPGMALVPGALQQLMARNPPATLAWGWLLMLAAMMAPVLVGPVRHVLDRSFARRRLRAVLLFVAGYTVLWMGAGVLIIATALAMSLFAPNAFVPVAIVTGTVFLWQCSPFKQRCLNRGHSHTELAAFGGAADLAALRFGVTHGIWCVGSCWALMLLPELFSRGHLAVMAAVTLWVFAEQFDKPMPPCWRLRGPGKAARIVVAQARRQ